MCFHYPSINHVPTTPLSPIICQMVSRGKFQTRVNKSCYQTSVVKKKGSRNSQISPAISRASPALSIVDTETAPDVWQKYEKKLESFPSERNVPAEGVMLDSSSKTNETSIDEEQKERDRRIKIGLANKGNVPWNKGRKHTTETRERISRKVKEAMLDPKVKKKMAECPRAHSEQTKERIGTSLKRLWAKKLRWKRSRAKFFSIWAEHIALAAKRGGCGQQELDWNSYDKIKEEIAIQQIRLAENLAEAKKAEKLAATQRKVERMARLAQNREAKEQRTKAGGDMKRKTRRKSKDEIIELTVSVGLKLKERLTKIHKRKISTNGQITRKNERIWEKLDLDFIKTTSREQEISLADQIQAAKTKRLDFDKESIFYSHVGNQMNEI